MDGTQAWQLVIHPRISRFASRIGRKAAYAPRLVLPNVPHPEASKTQSRAKHTAVYTSHWKALKTSCMVLKAPSYRLKHKSKSGYGRRGKKKCFPLGLNLGLTPGRLYSLSTGGRRSLPFPLGDTLHLVLLDFTLLLYISPSRLEERAPLQF